MPSDCGGNLDAANNIHIGIFISAHAQYEI